MGTASVKSLEHTQNRVDALTSTMLSKHCPVAGGKCLGSGCVHFREGYPAPEVYFEGEPITYIVAPPTCKLW